MKELEWPQHLFSAIDCLRIHTSLNWKCFWSLKTTAMQLKEEWVLSQVKYADTLDHWLHWLYKMRINLGKKIVFQILQLWRWTKETSWLPCTGWCPSIMTTSFTSLTSMMSVETSWKVCLSLAKSLDHAVECSKTSACKMFKLDWLRTPLSRLKTF